MFPSKLEYLQMARRWSDVNVDVIDKNIKLGLMLLNYHVYISVLKKGNLV